MKKQLFVVTAPVANLRKEPVEASFEYVCDDLQETQLLYNECLLCKNETEGWYFVEAVEQKKAITQDNWQGYPGWVKKASVTPVNTAPVVNAVVKQVRTVIKRDPSADAESLFVLLIGTRLVIEEERNDDYYRAILIDGRKGWIRKDNVNLPTSVMNRANLRKNIIETTKLFLGMPYLWGGRSAYVPIAEDVVTGVDCSSLTNLACRVNWLDMPRDAHDQWIVSEEIAYDTLEPADMIFISAEGAHDRITHVMIYLTREKFIEALETGSFVTINTFKNKFGLTLHEAARQGFVINSRRIYFGSVLAKGKGK